jgi:coenzyme F420-reducing hydrogenase beta subunit
MTSDGYEFYAYKSADEYDFNKAYVALDDITDVEKEEGKIRIYAKDGSVYEIFGLTREN